MNNKARFLWIALALLMAAPLLAQDLRLWDPMDGLPVRQGLHIEWFRSAASNDNGDFAMVWSDTRTGGRNLYMQVVDSDGNPLWDEDGKVVSNAINRQEDPHVMATSDGHWIVTWIDYRNDFQLEDVGDVFMMKYDQDGNPVWPNGQDGIEVCTAQDKQLWVQSFDDGAGGAVTIWVDDRGSSTDIYGQRIDADGNVLWQEDGIKLAGENGSDQGNILSSAYTADTDGAGGIIFGWIDTREATNHNLYANRVDVDGTLVWGDSLGVPICTAPELQTSFRMAPDGQGGAFWLWQDRRDPFNFNLYGQHTDASGAMSWQEDGAVICGAEAYQGNTRIVNSGVGEAIAVWEDQRGNFVNNDLYTQRISLGAGQPVFHWGDDDGMVLCDATTPDNSPADQGGARLFPDGTGGAIYTWVDERYGQLPNNDLFGQRVNASGNRVWGDPNGIPISDAVNAQDGNIIRLLDNNRLAIAWFDFRLGSPGLYYQILDGSGNELLQDNGVEVVYGIDGNGEFPQIIPAGGNDYWLAWKDGRLGSLGSYPFVQRITATLSGVDYQLAPNGQNIVPGFPYIEGDTTAVFAEYTAFVEDGQGGLISVWQDARIQNVTVLYAQRLGTDGDPAWGQRGQMLGYNENAFLKLQQAPMLLSDGAGGAYVAYIEVWGTLPFASYQGVRVQHIDSDGNPLWSTDDAPGLWVSEELSVDHELIAFEPFADGSMLVVYTRPEEDDLNNTNLYAKKVNTDGTLGWNGEELALCTAPMLQTNGSVTPLSDGAGNSGLVIAWEDRRRAAQVGGTVDIYAQFVDSDGTLHWDDDGLALVAQDNGQSQITVVSDGFDDTTFWMTWKTAQDGNYEDVMVQEYDQDGAPVLSDPNGTVLAYDEYLNQLPVSLPSPDGGLFTVFEEDGDRAQDADPAHFDLLYTTVENEGGEAVASTGFNLTGDYLTNAFHDQTETHMVPDGQGGYIIIWRDNRSTGKATLKNIYIQRVNYPLDVTELEPAVPVKMELGHAYPNPFNPSTTINFSIDRSAFVTLAVYDVLGRRVTKLVNEALNAGRHVATWNGLSASGTPVASGTYFYRLEVNGELMSRHMVLLK